MSAADYVATFVSIVMGLALADLGTSLHRLLRAKRRVRWDWLSPLAAFGTMLAVVAGWWNLYDAFSARVPLGSFLPVLVSLMLLFLLAAAALPDEIPEQGVDLRAYYLDNRTYFWGLFVLFLIATTGVDLLKWDGADWRELVATSAWKLVFLPVAGLLMWTRNVWIHTLALVTMLASGAVDLKMTVGG